MTLILHKVTCMITRQASQGRELLLIDHPHAGIQIPAGTVEPGEEAEEAAWREGQEETGLPGLRLIKKLGKENEPLPRGRLVTAIKTGVYSRPDRSSFNWASLRTGLQVEVLRRTAGFIQVRYSEEDDAASPEYITYEIMGWVPEEALTEQRTRHFYLFEATQETPRRWEVTTDNHRFELFWAPLSELPAIIPPQDGWLKWLAAT